MKQFRYILCILLSVFLAVPLMAQTSQPAQQSHKVTGVVLDEKGEPVIGATISVPGTTNGTVTDLDGKFSLSVSANQKTIKISYIGYQAQDIDITGKTSLKVTLDLSASDLNEVVVVGYGVQKKAHLTGAIATVAPQDILDLNVTDLTSALEGVVAGISVTHSGDYRPGDPARLTIRNYNSTVGSTEPQPLYVIDDVICKDNTAFNNLEPTMVESITVLKDAAAAVYGVRSGQGVILVKTKRGKEGTPKISYSGQFGYTDEVARPKMLDSYSYGVIWNGVRAADPKDTSMDPQRRIDRFQYDELEAMRQLNYDLLEREWSSALTQKHSINLSGGTERMSFFAGVAYNTQDGNLGKIDYDRWNYSAGLDAKVDKWIKASFQLTGDYSDKRKAYNKVGGSDDDIDYNGLLSRPRYIPDYIEGYPIAAYGISNGSIDDFQNYNFKTVQELNNFKENMTQNMTINSSLEWDFGWCNALKGLKLKGIYAKSIATTKGNEYGSPYNIYSLITRGGSGAHLYTGTEGYPLDMSEKNLKYLTISNGNILSRSMSRADNFQLNFIATYNRTFGLHNVGGLFTIEKSKYEYENLDGSRGNPTPYTNLQFNTATGDKDANDGRSESGMLSYVGRLNYSYSDKYLLEYLIRSDASTNFAPENFWGLFHSVSAGWVISEESWFKNNIRNIDFLKIRGSFGLLGQDNVPAWQWMQFYDPASNKGPIFGTSIEKQSGGHIALPDASVNDEAHWNSVYKTNLGIDLYTLNNRLSVTMDGYYDFIRDAFQSRTGTSDFPSTVGARPAEENYAAMNNYGMELSLGWKDKIGKDFKYHVKLNSSLSDSKLIKEALPDLVPIDGKRLNERLDRGIWGYECIGMFHNYQEIDEYFAKYNIVSYMGKSKADIRPGMLIYNNVRGSQKPDGSYYGPNDPADPKAGYVDSNDIVQISKRSSNPYGFTVQLGGSWKDLSFNMLVGVSWGTYALMPKEAYSIKSLISNLAGYNVMQFTNLPSFWANNMFVYEDVLDAQGRIVAPQNLNAEYPNLRFTDVNGQGSTFWMMSGTSASIRNFTLAYSLPGTLVKKVGIESCRFSLTAQNLLSLYNPFPDHFFDPMAGKYGTYPNLRKITLGLNVSF